MQSFDHIHPNSFSHSSQTLKLRVPFLVYFNSPLSSLYTAHLLLGMEL